MTRNLVFLIVIALAAWLVLREVRRLRDRPNRNTKKRRFAKMVACDHCGMHVPESQAIRVNERVYCGEAHRRAAERS